MPWHVTPKENVASILGDGLQPRIGERSGAIGEDALRIHAFSTFADLRSADWLWEEFDEAAELALFHLALPGVEGAWTELDQAVPPASLSLLSLNAGDISSQGVIKALEALDRVTDPLGDLASFRQTRVTIPARDFGLLVGDMQWEDDGESEFLVYAAGYWIEALDDGAHMLTIGNQGMITGDGTTLEDLEAALFDYAVTECRPEAERPAQSGPGF